MGIDCWAGAKAMTQQSRGCLGSPRTGEGVREDEPVLAGLEEAAERQGRLHRPITRACADVAHAARPIGVLRSDVRVCVITGHCSLSVSSNMYRPQPMLPEIFTFPNPVNEKAGPHRGLRGDARRLPGAGRLLVTGCSCQLAYGFIARRPRRSPRSVRWGVWRAWSWRPASGPRIRYPGPRRALRAGDRRHHHGRRGRRGSCLCRARGRRRAAGARSSLAAGLDVDLRLRRVGCS